MDLLYYAIDRNGRRLAPDSKMPIYDVYGRALSARRPSGTSRIRERFFDLARNWALVRSMLTHREATVDRIFVAPRIEKWLLAYARATREPAWLQRRAAVVLRQPSRDMGHDDHMHVRIRCSARDIRLGRCTEDLAPHRRRKWRTRVACPARPAPVRAAMR